MNKRVALVSVILLAAIVVAVVGATAALRLISGGTFGAGGSPISEADVRRSLAAAPSTPATTPGSAGTTSPASSQSASPHASKTTGGQVPQSGRHSFGGNTVLASCLGSQARLTSWFPASGYGVDDASQGPARAVWVKFKSASIEITVTVSCPGGKPQFTRTFDERGSGRGGGAAARSASIRLR